MTVFHCLQWGELSKRPQAGAGGMPDLALQLRVSKNALRSPAFQEEVVSQVCSLSCQLLPTDLLCYGHSSKTSCFGWLYVCVQQLHVDGVLESDRADDNAPLSQVECATTLTASCNVCTDVCTHLLAHVVHANSGPVCLYKQASKRLLALTAWFAKGPLLPHCAIMHLTDSALVHLVDTCLVCQHRITSP